ncbi:C2H2-type zinc finger transcription factor [Phycomyces blakesleeanus]|uniref:C2H2-type zinc finger transcription factor n=2 Tax=Phycomyces blakesleeanus TaxID=4837 RepID=A0A167LQC6_PHYB8|nr:C2H2-type zinc finger transcription factor [Phycomyces blakesleeanus NRRL 1555(-)]OAD70897.1 C2H2-type zinc finger transcription factor [Phycomyces blakesleeanus NRRL 1555(-)]|eukprot:XP_018288937.1 C2H2-type zinc finger transcription factor [Phycomyces blakesleeanus NRRL 1555(-)]
MPQEEEEVAKIFACPQCPKIFATRSNLKRHMENPNIHNIPYIRSRDQKRWKGHAKKVVSKEETTERMRKWRAENREKNRQNDLRCRVYRLARQKFGEHDSPEKQSFVRDEITRRLGRRMLIEQKESRQTDDEFWSEVLPRTHHHHHHLHHNSNHAYNNSQNHNHNPQDHDDHDHELDIELDIDLDLDIDINHTHSHSRTLTRTRTRTRTHPHPHTHTHTHGLGHGHGHGHGLGHGYDHDLGLDHKLKHNHNNHSNANQNHRHQCHSPSCDLVEDEEEITEGGFIRRHLVELPFYSAPQQTIELPSIADMRQPVPVPFHFSRPWASETSPSAYSSTSSLSSSPTLPHLSPSLRSQRRTSSSSVSSVSSLVGESLELLVLPPIHHASYGSSNTVETKDTIKYVEQTKILDEFVGVVLHYADTNQRQQTEPSVI